MSYWKDVRETLKKGVDLSISNLKSASNVVAEKTKEGALAARVKTKIFLKQRELHDVYADLGDAVHEHYKAKTDIYSDDKIKSYIEKADKLIEECKVLEKEMEKEQEVQ